MESLIIVFIIALWCYTSYESVAFGVKRKRMLRATMSGSVATIAMAFYAAIRTNGGVVVFGIVIFIGILLMLVMIVGGSVGRKGTF